MKLSTEHFLERCFDIASIEELNVLIGNVLKHYGMEYWSYVGLIPKNPQGVGHINRPVCYTNHPSGWVNYYFEEKFSQIDPVLKAYSKHRSAIRLQHRFGEENVSEKQKETFESVSDIDLDNGVTIPIFSVESSESYAIFTCIPDRTPKDSLEFFIQNKKQIVCMINIYHLLIKNLHLYHARQDFNLLTKREIECLQWVAKGKTDDEIGTILGGISKKTVANIVENTKRKLDCYNRPSLVVKAIQNGYLSLNL